MGHANISITLDRYGHLMPGNEDEAGELLDAYFTAQREREDERRGQRNRPGLAHLLAHWGSQGAPKRH
jgi:hypothetical protein